MSVHRSSRLQTWFRSYVYLLQHINDGRSRLGEIKGINLIATDSKLQGNAVRGSVVVWTILPILPLEETVKQTKLLNEF